MDFLTNLWLPILLSGIAVWFVSAVFWMAVGHHKKDTLVFPDENRFIEFVKSLRLPPGNYQFPDYQKCKDIPKERKKEAIDEMFKSGAMGQLRVWGSMNMGVNMFLTFLYFLVTSAALAYLGWAVLPHGSTIGVNIGGASVAAGMAPTFGKVFQVIGTAGILAYCFASFPNDIWFQKSKRAMFTCFIDGVVFALVTAAIFAYFWPK